jgi:threonine synthase
LRDEFSDAEIAAIVSSAVAFPAPLMPVADAIAALELFHGPTLAFKDFGARFLAQVLTRLRERGETTGPVTILSATSGDTGAAVAHAFHGQAGVQVVILYPDERISPLQEKMFCTLGSNIHTVAVDGDFDTCQALVKHCFADSALVTRLGLNSANSINVARLLAQVFYYFEAVAQLGPRDQNTVVFSVPSGNFGNLTAGLLARALGLPVRAFVVATNANDTVPRYLESGKWEVRPTIATLSNAMDVSAPNNWPRVVELLHRAGEPDILRTAVIGEDETRTALRDLWKTHHYLSEPHGAVAYAGLRHCLEPGEYGVFLGTAHPAKFRESVGKVLGAPVVLPPALAAVANKPVLSTHLPADKTALRQHLAHVLNL